MKRQAPALDAAAHHALAAGLRATLSGPPIDQKLMLQISLAQCGASEN